MQARVYLYTCIIIMSISPSLRDGQLEKLGGGGAKYKKKYLRKGTSNEKNSCMQINPKKYSCYGLKKCIQGIW